jgi:hypothetical protein
VQHGAGQQAACHQITIGVRIPHDRLQQTHTLCDSRRQFGELATVEHQRDGVETPRPTVLVPDGSLGIEGHVVHEVSCALGVEESIGLTLTLRQQPDTRRSHCVDQRHPRRTRRAVDVESFVVPARFGLVAQREIGEGVTHG